MEEDFLVEEEDFDASLDLETWKKTLAHLKPFKRLVLFGVLWAIVIAVLETLFPLFNRFAIDHYLVESFTKDRMNELYIFAGIYMAFILLFAYVIRVFIRVAGKIETSVAASLREQAFKKLQELSFSYYDKTPNGWIMSRMTSDSRKLSNMLAWGMIDIGWSLMLLIMITIVMLVINLKLALITLSVVPFLVAIALGLRKTILRAWRKVRKTNSKITAAISEGISGAITSKSLVLEDKQDMEFGLLTSGMRKSSVRAVLMSSLLWPVVLILGYVGTALASYYGGILVFEQIITVGTLFAFIQYTFNFFEPILNLSRILSDLQEAQAAGERIVSLIESEPDIMDTEAVIQKYGTITDPKTEAFEEIEGTVTFDNVTFKYDKGETVLDQFDLEIPAGETYAIVGETGSGKSTIVNLLSRFYEPTDGRVLIDQVDYKERSIGWLHSNLGYVLQDPHLFTGSIKENIRYGRLDATDEEIIQAAKTVNAHDFILKTPNGYDSEVGESGNKLSVGEKQLISFARAVLADPRILILDEATSSIDTETEQLIQDAIQKLLKGRTSVVIAHRLSTIVGANQILVLKRGIITERGTHKELLEAHGYYHDLYMNQFKENKSKEVL